MSLQFDSLHDGLEALRADMESYSKSVQHFVEFTTSTFVEAERRECELRDDLHAVANRVESLTRLIANPFEEATHDDAA